MPPENERIDIIKTLHDSLIEGHKGFYQTYNKIRERYVWKDMRNEIQIIYIIEWADFFYFSWNPDQT